MKKRAVLAGLCAVLVVSQASAATQEEKAGARAAAVQGETAFNQKRWADAVDLFSRAESLVHSPVHLLFKARALVQLGQLVKARETYLEITREQVGNPSPALLKSQDAARQEEATLEPRLANVTIKLDGPGAADATVTMDGAKVPAALVGLSRPIDPGQHTFQAAGSTSQSDTSSLSLKEGGSATVVITLKPIPGVVAAPVAVAPAPTPSPPPPATSPAQGSNGLRIGSYVAFGVGAVGLAVGTVFALSAKGKYDDANALCKAFPCELTRAQSDSRDQLGSDGDKAKTLSLVGFIAGGVGVAAGTTLLVLSSQKSEAGSAEVEPWLGIGSFGLRGKF